jgi:hypothetical protein
VNNLKKIYKVNDVKQATFNYIFSRPVYYVSIFIIIIIGIILAFITTSINFIFIAIFCVFFIIFSVSSTMLHFLMEQFAKNLGYEYSPVGEMSSVSGVLFDVGHSKWITHVISGRDDKHIMRLFCYSFTVGQGKHSHTYNYAIFENTFSGNMPHILLKPKISFLNLNDFVSLDFANSISIKLEGNFNKYFSLEVEKEFEIEAYQIFSVNFMEKLINTSKKFGFEFYQNKLYIYYPKFINKMSEVSDMFYLCDELSDHIEPANKRIGDDVDSLREAMAKYGK